MDARWFSLACVNCGTSWRFYSWAATSHWRVVRALLDLDTGHPRRFVSKLDVARQWKGLVVWNDSSLSGRRWVEQYWNWSPLHRLIHSLWKGWLFVARQQEGENVGELQHKRWDTKSNEQNTLPSRSRFQASNFCTLSLSWNQVYIRI